jgi:Nitrous oxide-stimulated promoter
LTCVMPSPVNVTYYPSMEQFTTAQIKDLKVIVKFVGIHCADRHRGEERSSLSSEMAELFPKGVSLCADCRALVEYALLKRRRCPLDPKPACKHCHVHCYGSEHREKMKRIMAFSGRKMIMRGRLDYLWHYFF